LDFGLEASLGDDFIRRRWPGYPFLDIHDLLQMAVWEAYNGVSVSR
jgi:hypothetical protein